MTPRGELTGSVLQAVLEAGSGGIASHRVVRWCRERGVAGTPAAIRAILSREARAGTLTYDGLYRARQRPPRRVQLSRRGGWRMPPNTVKVDRTTKWGNPWRVWGSGPGSKGLTAGWYVSGPGINLPGIRFPNRVAALEHCLERYRTYVLDAGLPWPELAGKDLACWCPQGAPCHADVLLELANWSRWR